jgi:hypothetical protein
MSSSRWLRLSLGFVSCISLAAAACDRPSDITSPKSDAIVPQYSQGNANGNANAFAIGQKDLKPVAVSVTASGYNVCEVGNQGGICIVDGVKLEIPAKTVPAHTRFTIDLSVGPYVTVKLAATSPSCWFAATTGAPACSNDIGGAGFKNPIRLTMSTFGATTTTRLLIGWASPAGGVPQHTVDNGDGTLTATVNHFSEFFVGE